jgi:hypothetical protein
MTTIEAKGAARNQARAAVDLLVEACAGMGDAERLAYWDQVRDELLERCGEAREPERPEKPCAVSPMGDLEARSFEAEQVPFGRHAGRPAGECLAWLDWLVGQRDDPRDFANRARRYLAREDVRRRLFAELEDE